MVRLHNVPGEKPLFWVGTARDDLMKFLDAVKDEIGIAFSVARFGGKHPKATPWKGEGTGVLEIVASHRGDTYRAMYTVRFANAVYVLHAFQKKSPSGIRTSQNDIDMIARRLKIGIENYGERYAKRSK